MIIITSKRITTDLILTPGAELFRWNGIGTVDMVNLGTMVSKVTAIDSWCIENEIFCDRIGLPEYLATSPPYKYLLTQEFEN